MPFLVNRAELAASSVFWIPFPYTGDSAAIGNKKSIKHWKIENFNYNRIENQEIGWITWVYN